MTSTEFIEEIKRHIEWESQRQERYEKHVGEELNKAVLALQEHRLESVQGCLFSALRFLEDAKELAAECEAFSLAIEALTKTEEA